MTEITWETQQTSLRGLPTVGPLTMYGQVEITAVKLVPGGNLTPVSASKVRLGCDDVHLKRMDLQTHARAATWEEVHNTVRWTSFIQNRVINMLYVQDVIMLASDLGSLWSVCSCFSLLSVLVKLFLTKLFWNLYGQHVFQSPCNMTSKVACLWFITLSGWVTEARVCKTQGEG